MNLQEHIRKVLKEETSLQKRLMELFKNQGIKAAISAVGGFDNFSKILNLDLDNIDTQEMLVKNFIYHTKVDNIDVLFIEIRTSPSGNRILNVHVNTNDPNKFVSWYVNEVCQYMSNELFPFTVAPAWSPVFASRGTKIFLDAETIVDNEDDDDNN